MANYLKEMYEEKKEKAAKKFSKEKRDGFWERTKKRLAKASRVVGAVFLVGTLIALIAGGGLTASLLIPGLAFMIAPSIPKIWRKITGSEKKEVKKTKVKIVEKEDKSFEDNWKDFVKSVDKIKEKYASEDRTNKADYYEMKEKYETLLASGIIDLVKDDEHIKFFESYEEEYNRSLKEFMSMGLTSEKEIESKKENELDDKISKLEVEYKKLFNTINEGKGSREEIITLCKNFNRSYNSVYNYAKSIGITSPFKNRYFDSNKDVSILEIKSLVNTFVNLNSRYEKLSSTINERKESKENVMTLYRKFCDYYNTCSEKSEKIKMSKEFNMFVETYGIVDFIKYGVSYKEKKEDSLDLQNLNNKLSVLYAKCVELSSKMTSSMESKEVKISMCKEFSDYYKETMEYAKSIKMEKIFNHFVASKKIDVFLEDDVIPLMTVVDTVKGSFDDMLNSLNDEYLEIKTYLDSSTDDKLNRRILNRIKMFITNYSNLYNYSKDIGKKREFDTFISATGMYDFISQNLRYYVKNESDELEGKHSKK